MTSKLAELNQKIRAEAAPDPIDFKAETEVASQVVAEVASNEAASQPATAAPPEVASVPEAEISLEDLTEADMLKSPLIVARPMGMNDSALNPKVLRKEYAYHFVNRLGRDGSQFSKYLADGWEVAVPNVDIEVLNMALVKDGCYIVGDVICMKKPKLEYFGQLKANHQRSEALTSKKAIQKHGEGEFNKAVSSTRGPLDEIRRKVGVYHPPIGEL